MQPGTANYHVPEILKVMKMLQQNLMYGAGTITELFSHTLRCDLHDHDDGEGEN